jgi:hypothetical protein
LLWCSHRLLLRHSLLPTIIAVTTFTIIIMLTARHKFRRA